MEKDSLRFVWGTPRLGSGRWRWNLVNIHPRVDTLPSSRAPDDQTTDLVAGRRYEYYVNLRALVLGFATAAFVAYFAAAALFLLRFEHKHPGSDIGYLDVVLPPRWKTIDRARGASLIHQARTALTERRYRDALGLFRAGLTRDPDNTAARLDLARLYAAVGLPAKSMDVLREGLRLGYPGQKALAFAFSHAAEADNPEAWLALCHEARARFDSLPAAQRPPDDALWLDRQTAHALSAAGRHEEALALLQKHPADPPELRHARITATLGAGRAREALQAAEDWAAAHPGTPEALCLIAQAAAAAGDFSAMDSGLKRLRSLEPDQARPFLFAYAQHSLVGRSAEAAAALDQLFLRFGANPDFYSALGATLMLTRDASALDRMETELSECGFSPANAWVVRLGFAIEAQDWASAARLAAALQSLNPENLKEDDASWIALMGHLAQACIDGSSGTQSLLVEKLAALTPNLKVYRLSATSLLAAGRSETAREILRRAEGRFPDSVSLARLLEKADADSRALQLAHPAPAAAPRADETFASLDAFASAFEARLRAGDAEAALRLGDVLRRERPDWLSAAETRVEWLELPAAARSEDPLRLRGLARSLLTRDPEAGPPLVALAKDLCADPARRSHAGVLLKEILRHKPESTEASQLLKKMEPPSPPLAQTPEARPAPRE
jgi:predicted Zn-dependent protease